MDAPRDNLIRWNRDAQAAADGRTMFGYAAVFNSDTVINSWEGNFVERIAPGAFKRTLRNNSDRIKVLFNHGMDPTIGDKPLGRANVLKEDDKGLYVEVPLDETSYNDDLLASLRSKAIDGMSFRFSVPEGGDTWEQPKRKGQLPVRTVNEAKLYELGPVTFPAYQASTAGVRSGREFSIWQALDEDRRSQIFDIIGTNLDGPAHSTPPGSPATQHEPDPAHTTSIRHHQLRARARLLIR